MPMQSRKSIQFIYIVEFGKLARFMKFFLGVLHNEIEDYAKHGGHEEVYLRCSFDHDPLQCQFLCSVILQSLYSQCRFIRLF